MLGKNIKVHFAGSDGEETFNAALTAADVRYRLYSCYKYIVNKKPDDDFTLPTSHVIRVQAKENKHVIQDSGLFTLMFGAGKHIKQTRQSLTEWQDKMVKFVLQNELDVTCVEIDCQKVLGVDDAWFFRERMKQLLPNRQINVFHYEDGKYGLDRLIEFSDYIAIGCPELRIVKPKTYKQDVCKLVAYIKKRKPNIDIHLLGCTEAGLLKENSFCTSSDSTSWLSGVKYGHIDDGTRVSHVNNFKTELVAERKKTIQNILKDRKIDITPKMVTYTTNASICASICKARYERSAGGQE